MSQLQSGLLPINPGPDLSIDRKLAAIAEHASQFPPGFAEARRDLARTLGRTHGVEFAES